MGETMHGLPAARQAYRRHQWDVAFDGFASTPEELDGSDLAAYSDAAWWLGRNEEAIRLTEAAYHALLRDSRRELAAQAALDLAVIHLLRGDEPRGVGWLGRAEQVARDVPEGPLHGHLLYVTAVEANFGSSPREAVVASARKVQEYGHQFHDPDLVAAGLNGEGRALLSAGDVGAGLALLDQSMVRVVDGDVTPKVAGNLYCNTIAAYHEVSELDRMARWTDAAEAWVASLSAAALFNGICRIHRAQLVAFRGAWGEAERTAHEIATKLAGLSVSNSAEAWYVVGEVRRLRGDRAGARAAYDEAHARGRDPQPGLALVRLDDGDPEGAMVSIRSALAAAGSNPLARARINGAVIDIALATDHHGEARAAAAELVAAAERYDTSGLHAMAAAAHGAVLLATGRPQDALPVLRDACRRWRDLGGEYDAATACLRLAEAYRALDDEPSAALEIRRASEAFAALGAAPAQARVRALTAPPTDSRGITAREREVLALVADGRTNRQIAEALYISDRTVARHLANIFCKLDVTSRTEAARYALDHRLVPPTHRA